MNILFDLYTPQHFTGGAGEYIRKVFYTLLDASKTGNRNANVIPLVDTSLGKFAYPDLMPEALRGMGLTVADIAGTTLADLLPRYNIDKVFIGAAQYWGGSFDVENIVCPAVCVVHDICDEEFKVNTLREYEVAGSLYRFVKRKIGMKAIRLMPKKTGVERMQAICRMLDLNKHVKVVTVSEFSKHSLEYNLSIAPERVHVLYSPERIACVEDNIHNDDLRRLVESGKKYYLMLSANRWTKNPQKAVRAFDRLISSKEDDSQVFFVTLGYEGQPYKNQVVMPYLDESDLVHAMRHCYALVFPSFFEGFGYPPLEAMKYGKPVLASNVTSIPEVLADSAIYFSPFYESDIYKAFCTLNDTNYEHYSRKALDRHAQVAAKQASDLRLLIDMITHEE